MPIIPQIKKKKKEEWLLNEALEEAERDWIKNPSDRSGLTKELERDTLFSEANNLSLNLIESRAWGRDWSADTLDGRKI